MTAQQDFDLSKDDQALLAELRGVHDYEICGKLFCEQDEKVRDAMFCTREVGHTGQHNAN